MLHSSQQWNKIRISLDVIVAGVGQTGLTPTVAIKRASDGLWLQAGGGSWGAGYAVNDMTELDATNLAGFYIYNVPGAQLDVTAGEGGYIARVMETVNSVVEHTFVAQLLDKATVADAVLDEEPQDHLNADSLGAFIWAMTHAKLSDESDPGTPWLAAQGAHASKFYIDDGLGWPVASESDRYAGRLAALRHISGVHETVKVASIADGAETTGQWFVLTGPDGGALRYPVAVGDRLFVFLDHDPAVADAVWDEALAGHLTAGTAGDAVWRTLALRQDVRIVFTAWSRSQPTAGYMLLYASKAAHDADVSPWAGATARIDFVSPHSGATPQSYSATKTS